MFKIKLPIFFSTDATRHLSKMDIDYPIEDCSVRVVIFYRIDSIAPYSDEENKTFPYTTISSGGDVSICQLSIEDVEKLIEIQYKESLK